MSAIDSLSSSNPQSSTSAFGTLSSDEFLEIIFAELQGQDPLEPQDTSAMIDQISQLRSIESDTQMADSISRLVSQNEFAAASSLIGSLVSGVSLSNGRVADEVISVSQTDEGPILNLFDGARVRFDQVDEVVGPITVDPGDGAPENGEDDAPDDETPDDGAPGDETP